MPRVDIYHHVVRRALIKEHWTITHDPFVLPIGRKRLFVDLGATHLLSADKDEYKIAVEVKSFVGASDVYDLEQAVGRYVLYHKVLARQEPDRQRYLAVTIGTFGDIFTTELGALLLDDATLRLLVFNEETEDIVQWLPTWTTLKS